MALPKPPRHFHSEVFDCSNPLLDGAHLIGTSLRGR